jgi:hypothetical protein
MQRQLTRKCFARLFFNACPAAAELSPRIPWCPSNLTMPVDSRFAGGIVSMQRRSAIRRRLTQQARSPPYISPALTSSIGAEQPSEHQELPTSGAFSSCKQRIHDILHKVEVGQLQLSQIELIVNEMSDLNRSVQQGRIVYGDPVIPYLRHVIQRLVDEVDYWYVRPSTFQLATEPAKSHLVVALRKVWFYAIISITHLPKVVPVKAGTSEKSTGATVPEQPFVLACQLLVNMLQLHHQHPTIYPEPNNTLYNNVLYSCYLCSSVSDEAILAADAILQNIERATPEESTGRFSLPKPPESVTLTHGMYNHMILMHAERAATVYGAAAQAEDWLMRMAQNQVQPTQSTFNRVLHAWAESPEKEGGNRAAKILHLMVQLSDEADTVALANEIAPNAISFGTVILAYMKRQQPEACQFILEEALAYQTKHLGIRAGTKDLTECWTTTLFGWSKSDRENAAERIEALLHDGIWIDGRQHTVQPTSSMHGACVEALLRSKGEEQAEQYLRRIVEETRNHKKKDVSDSGPSTLPTTPKPTKCGSVSLPLTATEFSTVINAWYRSHSTYEAVNVEEDKRHPIGFTATNATNVLQLMLELEAEGFAQCAPSHSSYFMCIDSWCKTAKRFMKATESIDSSDTETIKARKRDAVNAMKKAVSILDVAESRTLSSDSSYAVVIQTLCHLQDPICTFEACQILQRYEEKADAWNLNWQQDTAWMYVEVTKCLSLMGTPKAAELALHILQRIPKVGKRVVAKNKNWIYKYVLSAYSRCPGPRAGMVVSELFVELTATITSDPKLNNSLNVDLCERILWILVYSRSKESACEACDILYTIMKLYFDGKSTVEPSSRCFDACVHALCDCIDERQVTLAVELVELIVEKYKAKRLSHLPSRPAFDKLINSCKRIGSEEMTRNATELAMIAEKYSNVIPSLSKKSSA